MSFKKPLKLFIAYAHEDESFKDELTKRLKPLKQGNEIKVWHDGEVLPGDKWRDVRDLYLHNADVVLYLVSADSLASDACNKEIANTLGDQKRFIPIILRECDWKRHKVGGSSITEFHALPKDGKPIDSWEKKDEAWQNVIDGIHKILDSAEKQEDTLQSILFELGNAKYILGAFDEALANYTKAIELKPDNARVYNNRGNLFSRLKQYDKAEADYNKAIELKPDYAAYNNRGILFDNFKQYDKAEADFTKAIELKPDLAEAYANRGNLFRALEKYDKAKVDYNKAIELKPGLAEIYANRGVLFSNLKQYNKAEADYNKAIELKPDFAEAYNNRSVLFGKLEQYEKAEADYNKAIELKPDFAEAYNNRGGLFCGLKQYDKAEADYNKAIELNPNYAEAYYNRGILFYELKQCDKAEADFDKAIELKPDHGQAYNNRGNLFYGLKQYGKAEADFDKAIELKSDHVQAYYNRGSLFYRLKQYNKAEADYDKAIELEPNYVKAYYNRGNLFYELRQYDKAEADFDKAIELKPDHGQAYNNRGGLLYGLKQYDKAEADFDKAIELEPNYAEAYYNRGLLFSGIKQYDKAEADYTKAIELEPSHAIIYNNRGGLLHELGQYDKAKADFDKAIELNPDFAGTYYNRGNLLNELKRYNEAVADVKKAKVLSQQEGNQGGVAVCELWLNKNRPSSDSSIKPLKGRESLLTGRNKSKEERILEVMYDLNHSLKGCETQSSENSERIDELQRLSGVLARTCSIFLRKMVIGDRGNKKTRLLDDEILQSLGLKFSKIIKIPKKRKPLDIFHLVSSSDNMILEKINENNGLPESSHDSSTSPIEYKISIDWPLPGVANWTENPTEENMWYIQEKELFNTKNNDVFDCDQWLGQQLVMFDDTGITLKDVIKTVANYEGAHASNVFHFSQPESDKKNYKPAIRPEPHILNNIKFFGIKYSHIIVIESALYLYEKLIKNDLCKSMRCDSCEVTLCFASPSPENTFLEYSKWLRYDGGTIPTFGNEKIIILHQIKAVG